jgi:hypothetical protein
MPVSATEFWQTVRLDIETSETRDLRLAQPRLQWGDWLGQHQWAVATATALFVVVLGLGGLLARTHRGTARRPVKVVEVNTDIPQTAVTTLYSPKAGVTVLWTSGLPWTKDVNAMHNAFANLDT